MDLVTQNPFDTYQGLSTLGETASADIQVRNDALACISGGYRDKETGYPKASRNGIVYLSDPEGRAPELKAILEANGGKFLSITPCSDNPSEFFQERFAKRGKTRLEAYGDATGITEIKVTKWETKGKYKNPVASEHIFHEAGTPRFEELRKECKVEINFFFYLCEWDANGNSKLIFRDGLAPYRLRTTSQETRSGFLNQFAMVAGFSHGKVRGVPFELRLINKTKTDGHGTNRDNVPIFKVTVKPPGGLELNPESFNQLMRSGIAQSEQLSLPAPTVLSIEDAVKEVEVDVYDPLDTERKHVLENGVDKGFRRRQWFGMTKDTVLSEEDHRLTFMDGADLDDTLSYSSDEQWTQFLNAARDYINKVGQEAIQAQAAKDNDDPSKYHPDITQKHRSSLNKIITEAGLKATDALDFIAWLSKEKLTVKRDISPETVDKAEAKFTELKDAWQGMKLIIEAFERHRSSDEEVAGLLA